MHVIARLKYGFVSWLGRVLAQVRVNKLCKMHIDLHTYYAKKRLWFGAALIAAGNIYLKRLVFCRITHGVAGNATFTVPSTALIWRLMRVEGF